MWIGNYILIKKWKQKKKSMKYQFALQKNN